MPPEKIKIALVCGDSLKEQSAKLWEGLDERFKMVVFCGRKNVFPLSSINLEIKRLPSTADNFLSKNYFRCGHGSYRASSSYVKLRL